MRGQDLIAISDFLRTLLFALLLSVTSVFCQPASAAEPHLVTSSGLGGFTFNDYPLLLPVERNFQMAMITASADIGRSCGKIEAYGWQMKSNEQSRVNRIFNDTVNGLRDLGYKVEAQNPSSVSRDVTLITADRPDKHLLLMWSAGDIGLVMAMCESSETLHNRNATAYDLPPPKFSPQFQAVEISPLGKSDSSEKPDLSKAALIANDFSPVGDWIGSYSCHQGYTGGTLHISRIDGKNFDGVFRFYPTPKNPSVPPGSYNVYGEYDAISKRVIINPGQWIERPRNYYNTIILGSFDTEKRTFSGYFQGVTGCTSFEANYAGADLNTSAKRPSKSVKKTKSKRKKVTAKKPAMPANAAEAPLSIVPDQPPPGILSPTPAAPTAVPSGNAQPAKKSEASEPETGKKIVLAASGQWFTPTVPQVQPAPSYITQPPQAPQAPVVNLPPPQIVATPQAPQAPVYNTTGPQVPTPTQVPAPTYYITTPQQVPSTPQAPQATFITPEVPTVPPAPSYTVGAGAR